MATDMEKQDFNAYSRSDRPILLIDGNTHHSSSQKKGYSSSSSSPPSFFFFFTVLLILRPPLSPPPPPLSPLCHYRYHDHLFHLPSKQPLQLQLPSSTTSSSSLCTSLLLFFPKSSSLDCCYGSHQLIDGNDHDLADLSPLFHPDDLFPFAEAERRIVPEIPVVASPPPPLPPLHDHLCHRCPIHLHPPQTCHHSLLLQHPSSSSSWPPPSSSSFHLHRRLSTSTTFHCHHKRPPLLQLYPLSSPITDTPSGPNNGTRYGSKQELSPCNRRREAPQNVPSKREEEQFSGLDMAEIVSEASGGGDVGEVASVVEEKGVVVGI